MKILYAASEALPYASTGGLSDVIGSLPQAVKKELGESSDVRVVIPLYPTIKQKYGKELTMECETKVQLGWRNQYCGILSTMRDGVKIYFIDNEYYFNRRSLYGSFDDAERFAFFGKAILALMAAVDFFPDVLHANDWQTAPAVIYLKRKFQGDERYRKVSALFTIHNIGYQGIYNFNILSDVFDLNDSDRSTVDYNGCINLLKGAVVCADMVSTVSATYAREILTEYYASGLHHILRDISASGKLVGITNGIDVNYYNCATDPDIIERYDVNDLSGKALCKTDLQEQCGLAVNPDTPIIASVSRLASHKGFDLVRHVLEEVITTHDVQFVLLGTGEFELEDYFVYMQNKYPSKVCVKLEFNKALSKKFYAGADMFLMPSKSEPCGLSQMIASRYGAVPIVRETGGLADTIKPYNEYEETGNGFTFCNYNAHDMMHVISYAISMYHDQAKWINLVKNVMNVDFSWSVSAKKYIDIYQSIV